MKIPSRKDYGEDLRKQIWTSTKELAQNAKRNSMEYASEGWKLSGVIEEENFYFNHMTGEYVHPIHVHREHQKRVMQARQKAEAAKAA